MFNIDEPRVKWIFCISLVLIWSTTPIQGRIWPKNESWGTKLTTLKVEGRSWPFMESLGTKVTILPLWLPKLKTQLTTWVHPTSGRPRSLPLVLVYGQPPKLAPHRSKTTLLHPTSGSSPPSRCDPTAKSSIPLASRTTAGQSGSSEPTARAGFCPLRLRAHSLPRLLRRHRPKGKPSLPACAWLRRSLTARPRSFSRPDGRASPPHIWLCQRLPPQPSARSCAILSSAIFCAIHVWTTGPGSSPFSSSV
jgi:hypothetical protein